jgi:lysyl-tRNA synthetase class 2
MLKVLKLRNLLKNSVREFFTSLGYLEVDTPILSPYENPDDNVENVKVCFRDFQGREFNWFLQTSPEFFMKRLVWQGAEKIFQICKVFRNGEVGRLHNVEFTMVEWYRRGKDYETGIEETLNLMNFCGKKFGVEFKNVQILTIDEAFKRFAGVSVHDVNSVKKKACEETYETAFFKLLVEKVEPQLSKVADVVVLKDYPEKFGAFAKVKNGVAQRFEVYVRGVEIANGYSEMTDYEEYEKKFGKSGKKTDGKFLELLKLKPLPECEGVALGFDRLLMVLTGSKSLSEVLPFYTSELISEVSSP